MTFTMFDPWEDGLAILDSTILRKTAASDNKESYLISQTKQKPKLKSSPNKRQQQNYV